MKYLFTLVLCLMALYGFGQNLVFSNQNLKSYLLTDKSVDTNGDENADTIIDINGDNEIQISEALAVQNLVISQPGNGSIISSIEDIHQFSNLKRLTVKGDFGLSEISALSLNNLEHIRVSDHNSIREIDLSDLPNLKSIYLEGLSGVQNLNLQNGSAADAFSLFYTYVDYACVDSIAAEYDLVAEHVKSGGTITVNCALNVDEVEALQTVIYPNPAMNVIHISSYLTIARLELHDVSGKMIKNTVTPSGDIDISKLEAGLYVLSIEFENGQKMSKKIIIKSSK